MLAATKDCFQRKIDIILVEIKPLTCAWFGTTESRKQSHTRVVGGPTFGLKDILLAS